MNINLKFNKELTNLTGNAFGKEIYNSQIEDKIAEEKICAIIPDNIEDISSSFYEGIFSKLIEQYGIEKAHELLMIYSTNDYINKKIRTIRKVYKV